MSDSHPGGGASLPDVVGLWEWEYDSEFIRLLGRAVEARGLRFGSYLGDEIIEFTKVIDENPEGIRLVVDRASDVQPGLTYYLAKLKQRGARIVNDPDKMTWCRDKATMHLELLRAGVRVPYGLILSAKDKPETLNIIEMVADKLGTPFVIKPAEGGGGEGVQLDARDKRDVLDYFRKSEAGKVVLQRQILPRVLGEKRGWFRVFWIGGHVIPCWWDDRSHVYSPLEPEEEAVHNLQELGAIVSRVAAVCGMELFTTEIAVDMDGGLVTIDFVNEMPDLRLKSQHPDGVPDDVVGRIVEHLLAFVPP